MTLNSILQTGSWLLLEWRNLWQGCSLHLWKQMCRVLKNKIIFLFWNKILYYCVFCVIFCSEISGGAQANRVIAASCIPQWWPACSFLSWCLAGEDQSCCWCFLICRQLLWLTWMNFPSRSRNLTSDGPVSSQALTSATLCYFVTKGIHHDKLNINNLISGSFLIFMHCVWINFNHTLSPHAKAKEALTLGDLWNPV